MARIKGGKMIIEEFFKAFGVKPIQYITPMGKNCVWQNGEPIEMIVKPEDIEYIKDEMDKEDKNKIKVIYPEITAEKLLEMIIIRATNYKNGTVIELEHDSNIENLKYEVLRHFIDYQGNFDKHQIQQLFEE